MENKCKGKLLIILKGLPYMNELNITSVNRKIKTPNGFFKQTNRYIHLTKGKGIYFHSLENKFHVGVLKT